MSQDSINQKSKIKTPFDFDFLDKDVRPNVFLLSTAISECHLVDIRLNALCNIIIVVITTKDFCAEILICSSSVCFVSG